MGAGIAYVFSAAGLQVVLKDVDLAQLDRARTHIEGIYRRGVERGRIAAAEALERQALVAYTLEYGELVDVDLAVEAVPESMSLKQRVLSELGRRCPPRTILATNTSALSISELGAASGRPERLVGLHFFNPAHVMRLVEVVPGADTDPGVVQAVLGLARQVGKTPVRVRECPGFLVNRLLMPYLNEAVICLQEGAASPSEIDAALGREGFGWPMGPLALLDMLGLDVCHHIIAYLSSRYSERLQEAALLRALYEAGRYGQKSGAGFYEYVSGGLSGVPTVSALIQRLHRAGEVIQGASTFSVDRPMALLLNEAFLCVQEEVATTDDIELACIAGLGMQVRWEGDRRPMGPLEYADRVGLDVLLVRFQSLEQELGRRFRPAAVLQQKVRAGELGHASGRGFKEYTS
jgi:3-hydroxyacyl-CoA dehydrogenase